VVRRPTREGQIRTPQSARRQALPLARCAHLLAMAMLLQLLLLPLSAIDPRCIDDPGWNNGKGQGCRDYRSQLWCRGGSFLIGKEWSGGTSYNYPERACCVCGKQMPIPVDPPPPPAVKISRETPTYLLTEDDTEGGLVPSDESSALQARLGSCAACSVRAAHGKHAPLAALSWTGQPGDEARRAPLAPQALPFMATRSCWRQIMRAPLA
jgi:hypothetical protein